MEKRIFSKERFATASEKASEWVITMDGKVYKPRYLGRVEAMERLPEECYPCVYATKESGYVPVRFRDEKRFIVKKAISCLYY